jgi:hypothetical protein
LAVFVLSVAAVKAAEVRVDWPDAENATEVLSHSDVVQAGFVKAVNQEALAILPGEITPARTKLLANYLAPRAGGYILSYSEIGVDPAPTRTLVLDVTVNRPALKQSLKRLGVFYTVDRPQPFDLRLSGGAQAFWEDIGRLTMLSGLEVEDGADPKLSLSLGEDETLTGTLTSGERTWTAQSTEMEPLWVDLWSKWFTRPEAEEGVFRESRLVVTGWFSPDGVRAFDKLLATWEQEVESTELADVQMLPDGITARWKVRTLDRALLEDRLSEYLPGRGLSYVLEDVVKPAPEIDGVESAGSAAAIKNPESE